MADKLVKCGEDDVGIGAGQRCSPKAHLDLRHDSACPHTGAHHVADGGGESAVRHTEDVVELTTGSGLDVVLVARRQGHHLDVRKVAAHPQVANGPFDVGPVQWQDQVSRPLGDEPLIRLGDCRRRRSGARPETRPDQRSAGYGLVPQLDPAPSRSALVSPADHHQHGGDLDHHDQDSKNGAFVVPNRGVAAGQVCPVGQRLLPPLEIQHLAVVMERRSAGEDVVHCLRISRS